MSKSKSECHICDNTRIFISVQSRQRYAKASLCSCLEDPCSTCKSTGYIVEKDSLQRDVAIVCPDCEQIKHKVQLYNNARIPQRYKNSNLKEKDRDKENEIVFVLY